MFTYIGSGDSLIYWLQIRNHSTTGTPWSAMTSLDEGVWRCRHPCANGQMFKFSRAGPPGITVLLRGLDSDRRDKTDTEILYYVTSPNLWIQVEGLYVR